MPQPLCVCAHCFLRIASLRDEQEAKTSHIASHNPFATGSPMLEFTRWNPVHYKHLTSFSETKSIGILAFGVRGYNFVRYEQWK